MYIIGILSKFVKDNKLANLISQVTELYPLFQLSYMGGTLTCALDQKHLDISLESCHTSQEIHNIELY